MCFMNYFLHISSNRAWRISVLFILIALTSCQQGNQSPLERTPEEGKAVNASFQDQRNTNSNVSMTYYLSKFSYTPETWSKLMSNPEDRRIAAQKYIESVGGKLDGFWYAFGEYDGYCLWQAPDHVSMAAVGFAITGGGALSKFETTVLLTVDETLDALRRAQTIAYRAPGSK